MYAYLSVCYVMIEADRGDIQERHGGMVLIRYDNVDLPSVDA